MPSVALPGTCALYDKYGIKAGRHFPDRPNGPRRTSRFGVPNPLHTMRCMACGRYSPVLQPVPIARRCLTATKFYRYPGRASADTVC